MPANPKISSFFVYYLKMAASKEALAIVLDVGPGMSQAAPGHQTDLHTALDAINMIIQRKLFAQSKDEVSLVLFGTPDTANDLSDGSAYQNVTLARPLGLVDWELMSYVHNDVTPSNVDGDFLDAIVVAMDHLVKGIQGKKGFGSKRIIFFSNMSGEFGDDQLDDITAAIKEAEVDFNVIGPDLDNDEDDDDPRPGPSNGHAKPKTPQQRAGETLLKHMIDSVDGESYTFSEALPFLSYYQCRQVRSVAWKSLLAIGSSLQIPVCLYNRMKEAKPSSYKSVYAKDPEAPLERLRTYHLHDDDETEVEKADVVDGHRYGSTLVPFSEDDKDAMKYKTEKCFKLLCFTDRKHISPQLLLGDATWVCTAERGDDSAAVALSALINALYESATVGIVRRVYQANSQVRIGCLVPHIKSGYECLIYNELPFSEDLRQFTFGSLPVSEENTAANQKQAPTEEQLKLMDDLIDNMDLSKSKEEDDERDEALKPKNTFNPHLQRLYQCLQHRALTPDDPLPALSAAISASLCPSATYTDGATVTQAALKDACTLTMVAKDAKGTTGDGMFKDSDKGDGPPAKKVKVDDDDLKGGMADLAKAKVTEVGTVSPVEDFKTLISQKDEDKFDAACRMMIARITQLVTDSFGSQFYGKAVECVTALRQEAITNGEPSVFNDFLTSFKDSLREKKRTDFWDEIVDEKLSLITKSESEDSAVTLTEAADFLKVAENKPEPEPVADDDANEDLFDGL